MSQTCPRILIDQTGSVVQAPLVESDSKGILYAEGKIGECDKPTANGRVYPRKIMEREIAKLQRFVEDASAIGAVDHPGDGKNRIVNQAGTILRKVWMENDGTIYGRFEIVDDSSAGKDLAAFLRRGARIGVSSRGMGSTRPTQTGTMEVAEDFQLAAYDFVADPAVSDARPRTFTEDKDEEPWTVEQVRLGFPAQIAQIEESALMRAQLTCESASQATIEEAVNKARGEGYELGRAEVTEAKLAELQIESYVKVRQELEDDFGLRLIEALESKRAEIEESVRSEMRNDPAEISAKAQLEQVAAILVPFKPSPDVKRLLDEKDGQVQALRTQLTNLNSELAKRDERIVQSDTLTRRFAYEAKVEKSISGRPDADQLRESIGPVDQYENADELLAAISAALEEADALAEQADEANRLAGEEVERLRAENAQLAKANQIEMEEVMKQVRGYSKELHEDLADLRNQLAEREKIIERLSEERRTLSEQVQKTSSGAELGESLAYALRVSQGHPQAATLIESVQSAKKPMTTKEIDELFLSLTPRVAPSGGVTDRVKEIFASKGRGHGERTTLSESFNRESSVGSRPPGLEFLSAEDVADIGRYSRKGARYAR